MPAPIDTGRKSPYRQGLDRIDHGESAVATIWLIFYALAAGMAITSFLVPGAIEFAAR